MQQCAKILRKLFYHKLFSLKHQIYLDRETCELYPFQVHNTVERIV